MRIVCLLLLLCLPNLLCAGLADGIRAYNAGNYPKAIEILTPFAKVGESRSQTVLARIYLDRLPGHEKEGLYWAEQAAEVDSPEAFDMLGTYYYFKPED